MFEPLDVGEMEALEHCMLLEREAFDKAKIRSYLGNPHL